MSYQEPELPARLYAQADYIQSDLELCLNKVTGALNDYLDKCPEFAKRPSVGKIQIHAYEMITDLAWDGIQAAERRIIEEGKIEEEIFKPECMRPKPAEAVKKQLSIAETMALLKPRCSPELVESAIHMQNTQLLQQIEAHRAGGSE